MEDDNSLQKSNKWIEDLSKGVISHELEATTLGGLQIVKAHEGFICCSFIIPVCLADKDGNWQVGAMATLVDSVGATAVYSLVGQVMVSVDFSISFYSTAKVQEEVEIEGRVIAERGRLAYVQIEVRRKENGDLIALGRQWMSSKTRNQRKASKL